MKYIIDIEDSPFERRGSQNYYKAAKLDNVMFTLSDIDKKLELYNEDAIAQRGYDLARKIFNLSDDDAAEADLESPTDYATDKVKYDSWIEKNKINIGDEVEFEGSTFVVVKLSKNYKTVDGIGVTSDGGLKLWYCISMEDIRKTGRHSTQVSELAYQIVANKS